MKPEELMIGNWVDANRSECVGDGGRYAEWEEIGKVTRIYDDDTVMLLYPTREDDWEEIYVKDLEPIPLTPEILEKNGFIKSNGVHGIHAKCYEIDDKDKKYCLTIANYNKYKRLLLNVDSEDSECFNIKCDYVHQLQQALRLCGIEKEIEL